MDIGIIILCSHCHTVHLIYTVTHLFATQAETVQAEKHPVTDQGWKMASKKPRFFGV